MAEVTALTLTNAPTAITRRGFVIQRSTTTQPAARYTSRIGAT